MDRFNFDDPRTFLDLGWRLLYENNRLADAENAFKAALDLDPDNVEGRIELAVVYCLQDRHEEELAVLKEALLITKDNEDLAEVHLRLGIAYDIQGETDQAQQELNLLRELDPERAGLLEEIMKL